MFLAHPQEKIQYLCNTWYLSPYIDDCPAHIPHMYGIFSWWWAHSCPKHVERSNKTYYENCAPSWFYTGCNRRTGPDFGRVFLRSNYTDITKTPISKVQWLRRYWSEKFEILTAITHLLITKYILKLAGICGFCSVNICTYHQSNLWVI